MATEQAAGDFRQLRFLTFNVLGRDQAAGERRERVIQRGLAGLGPDIAALQEVTRTDVLDQAQGLLGPEYVLVDHPSTSTDGFGASLASRWPVRNVRTLDLHLTAASAELPWVATVAVEVLAPPPFGPILVVHHKPSWQHGAELDRERQAVAAAGFIEALVAGRPELPVVLLGDFDAAPDAASMRFWTGRQSLQGMSVRYEDAWEAAHPDQPGYTFTPANPLVRNGQMPLERGRRIDHILVRSGAHGPLLDVADCRLVFDQPIEDEWASDHFGVLADLRLPPHPPGTWR